MSKLVKVDISEGLALQVLTTGYRVEGVIECIDGLPEGARLMSAELRAGRDIRLIIKLLGEADAGNDDIPYVTPVYQRTYPEEC